MLFKEFAAKIIELRDRDLAFRDQLIQKGALENGYHAEMEKIHNENAFALGEMMDAIGYPTIEKVGKEGSEAAWLVIQHAIGQPTFMKNSARLLQKAVQEKKANPIALAYLTDRIAVFEGRPQTYGTQFDWDENGEMSPQKYDDLEKVNQRRQSIGLNLLEEQIEIIRAQVQSENQRPPEDFLKRNKEITEWKKKVGWVKDVN